MAGGIGHLETADESEMDPMRSSRRITLYLTLLTLVRLGSAGAAEPSLERIVSELQARHNERVTLRAHFEEVSVNKTLNKEFRSRGEVYLKKPGLMRWEYSEPEGKLIVSDGEKLWVYIPDQEQVVVEKVKDLYSSSSPLLFLTGEGELREMFRIERHEGGKELPPNLYALELEPVSPQPGMKKLILIVDCKDFLIQRSVVVDHYDNVIDIRFSQIVADEDIPKRKFTFKVPKGVDVVSPPRLGPVE